MKKITGLFLVLLLPLLTISQDGVLRGYDIEVFNICSMIFVVGLFMVFIVNILKKIMDYRIRNKVVDKGIPEHLANKILQPVQEENGDANIKWFFILAGLGAAFTMINYTQPLGIHSLAIMAFCIAGCFLGFYLFVRFATKKSDD